MPYVSTKPMLKEDVIVQSMKQWQEQNHYYTISRAMSVEVLKDMWQNFLTLSASGWNLDYSNPEYNKFKLMLRSVYINYTIHVSNTDELHINTMEVEPAWNRRENISKIDGFIFGLIIMKLFLLTDKIDSEVILETVGQYMTHHITKVGAQDEKEEFWLGLIIIGMAELIWLFNWRTGGKNRVEWNEAMAGDSWDKISAYLNVTGHFFNIASSTAIMYAGTEEDNADLLQYSFYVMMFSWFLQNNKAVVKELGQTSALILKPLVQIVGHVGTTTGYIGKQVVRCCKALTRSSAPVNPINAANINV